MSTLQRALKLYKWFDEQEQLFVVDMRHHKKGDPLGDTKVTILTQSDSINAGSGNSFDECIDSLQLNDGDDNDE